MWPSSREELVAAQEALARRRFGLWRPVHGSPLAGGCFACFAGAEPGTAAWAGAALVREGRLVASAVRAGIAGAPYEPGLLALRVGALLEAAVWALPELPDVLLVNAAGRDHPRRAGLALHLGCVLDLPTVGVTHRPLLAAGDWPGAKRGARSPLLLAAETVGYWLRTRAGARPLAVHAAWRTEPDAAAEVVLTLCAGARTPEPLRLARALARAGRAGALGGAGPGPARGQGRAPPRRRGRDWRAGIPGRPASG